MLNYCKTGLKLSVWFTINIPIVNKTHTPAFMSNNGKKFGDKAKSKKHQRNVTNMFSIRNPIKL